MALVTCRALPSASPRRGWDHTEGLLAAYQCAWRRNHLLHATATATAPTPPPPAPAPPLNATAAPAPQTAPTSRRLRTVDAVRALLGTAGGGSSGGVRRNAATRRLLTMQRWAAPGRGRSEAWARARRRRRALRASDSEQGGLQQLHPHHHRQHHNGSRLHPMLLLTDHGTLRASVAHGMLAGGCARQGSGVWRRSGVALLGSVHRVGASPRPRPSPSAGSHGGSQRARAGPWA